MKPAYFVIGLLFLVLSPALLNYFNLFQRGYQDYDPITQTTYWVEGKWFGWVLSWVAVIPLWVTVPLLMYSIITRNDSKPKKKNNRFSISKNEVFLFGYALLFVILYTLFFMIFPIHPVSPSGIENAVPIRSIALLTFILALATSFFFLVGSNRHKNECIPEVVAILALLLFGILLVFLNFGNYLSAGFVGTRLANDYFLFIPPLLLASGVISAAAWIVTQINRGKADPLFRFIRDKAETIPLFNFEPENVERVEVGIEKRSIEFKKYVGRVKFCFKIGLIVAFSISLCVVFLNTVSLLSSVSSSLSNPPSSLFSIVIALVSWYFYSFIPISVIIVFVEFVRFSFIEKEKTYNICSDKYLVSLVEQVSVDMNVISPNIILLDGNEPPLTIKKGDKHLLLLHSDFITKFMNSEGELKAVLAHEIAHIKNKDVNDIAIVQSLKTSLKTIFYWFSLISFPLILLFPFSLAFGNVLPFWVLLIALILFLAAARLLPFPQLIFPVIVSIIAAIIYIPPAIIMSKIVSLIEMNADLEAVQLLGDTKPIHNVLIKIKSSEKTTAQVIEETLEAFIEIIDKMMESSKVLLDYFLKTPGIIIEGIQNYCLAEYSTIPRRLKNLQETTVTKETWYTLLGRFVFFLKKNIIDTFRNKDFQGGLVVGAIYVGPIVFCISYVAVTQNLVLSIIYAILSVFILAKAVEYGYSFIKIVFTSNQDKESKKL